MHESSLRGAQPRSNPPARLLQPYGLRNDGSLWHGLRVQIRVIKALILREMITRFGRHNIGFLWMFIEPMLFSVGITVLWSWRAGHTQGLIPVAGFALTGYSCIVGWRNSVNRTSGSVKANKALLYHRIITIFDIAFSRALLEFASVSVSFVVLTLVFTRLDLMDFPEDLLQAVFAWCLLGWFFIMAGLVAVYLDESSEIFERVWHVFMYLSLPFTGCFSMVNWLPTGFQEVLLYSPMVHGVEMLRESYFGEGVHAIYDVGYLVSCNMLLTAVALLLISKVTKLVKAE
jgi:capsular polysaccharide transport system permease protein